MKLNPLTYFKTFSELVCSPFFSSVPLDNLYIINIRLRHHAVKLSLGKIFNCGQTIMIIREGKGEEEGFGTRMGKEGKGQYGEGGRGGGEEREG